MIDLTALWKGNDMEWAQRRLAFVTQAVPTPRAYQGVMDFEETEVSLNEVWQALRDIPALFAEFDIRSYKTGKRAISMNRYGQGDYTFVVTFADGTKNYGHGLTMLNWVEVKGQVQ